ncbi:MAG: hypothetical protein RSD81_08805 [Pseudomonas sp.]
MTCLQNVWRTLGLVVALALTAPVTHALEVTITAQYRGDASARFENTTPPAFFCQRWPQRCNESGLTGVLGVVDLPITFDKEVTVGNPRDEFYVKMPARRQVDIFRDHTGEPHVVPFEFIAVGQRTSGVAWNRSPLYNSILQGGCTRLHNFANPPHVLHLWRVESPQSPTACHASYNRAQPDYREVVTGMEMGVGYMLSMPGPYRMKPGIYRGSSTYSIGPGGDFDFGDAVTNLSGNSLTIHFVLDVQHAFFFDFPPGSDRAVLEPPGGWQAWLAGGSAPQRLYRDLPFRLSSTGPFKVYKLCQYDAGDRCGIRNAGSDEVPVEVALSLPGGIQYRGGGINRVALPTGRLAALQFEAVIPTLNRPGQLHFEVGRDDVRAMLANPGTTYTGHVTVVFDAEL